MKLVLNLRKTVQENANDCFEKAKKQRKKAEGAKEAIQKFSLQLIQEEKKAEIKTAKQKLSLEWYEKFRWFISSENFLCIGGRDATSNEVVIKKYTDSEDIVFHTEMPGSPFFIIKTGGKKVGAATLQETADATATYSKAWKLGLSYVDVFAVSPSQVSKQAQTGEYMPKGAFMVRGKRTPYQGKINLAAGVMNGKPIAGPEEAVKKHSAQYFKVVPGKEKPSSCAKFIAKKLKVDVDDVLRLLPGGTCQVK